MNDTLIRPGWPQVASAVFTGRAGCTTLRALVLLSSLLLAVLGFPAAAGADPNVERRELVETIAGDVQRTLRALGDTRFDSAVLEVMRRVPRHEFVPRSERESAYENRPLPIGYGQTISQPFIVALMTDLLNPDSSDVVLEVGTGSGYQAAVLSALVAEVHSIEIIPELAASAQRRLDRLGYDNVNVTTGDGYYGLADQAPFDAIIVTAAASHIPPPLAGQLAPGGRMVIPVGGAFLTQELILVEKVAADSLQTRHLIPVRFVPLTGGH